MNDRDGLRLFELLNALEEGVLSDADRAELVALLKGDDTARRLYLDYMGLAASLNGYAQEAAIAPDDPPLSIAELSRMEAGAVAELVELGRPRVPGQQPDDAPGPMSAHDLADAGRYLLRRALHTRATWVGAAAAALALTLVLVFMGNGPGQAAEQPPLVERPERRPVATLTAEHDAQWDRLPGESFYAGQRFTLTRGFAEITTARGAIAILEAPVTIELLDSPNAIRLHAGKLVGRCETESSKGFVVHTDHADVTDLGTAFGVSVVPDGSVSAVVFDGEVRLSGPRVRGVLNLAGGQAAADTADSIEPIAPEDFYKSANYARSMRDARARPDVEGQVLYLHHPPGSFDQGVMEYDNSAVLLMAEANAPVNHLRVNTLSPGRYDSKNAGQALPSRIRPVAGGADVYLLRLDPINAKLKTNHSIQCEIRFDRPVLGLVWDAELLDHNMSALGIPYMLSKEHHKHGTLDSPYGDREWVKLSKDRRTLRVKLSVKSSKTPTIDDLQIIVQGMAAD